MVKPLIYKGFMAVGSIKTVFEYTDYRKYLMDYLGAAGTRTGLRLKACQHLRCHSTYLSQVLSEKIHLSLEHAESLNDFFAHTKEQGEFFLLLVLKARAGTKNLKDRFESQINNILMQRNQIKTRVHGSSELSQADQDRFYSHWLGTALHVLVSIKEFQTPEALARATGVHIKRIHEELEFMLKSGLVIQTKGIYSTGPKLVHLGSDSNAITKHHTNWRFHSIQNISVRNPQDLHYSAAISLSKEAAQEIRESLLKALERHIDIIKKAPEEVAYVYNFDFYKLTTGNETTHT